MAPTAAEGVHDGLNEREEVVHVLIAALRSA